ncbi:MAG: PaaI family thioesterase [Candidatus Binatia bacterium]
MGNDQNTSAAVGCFGCSTANDRGLGLVFERRDGLVEASTTLGESFAGYDGLVHGGIVSTLLDEAMGWAILELAGRFAVTRSLTVDFRRPVLIDRPLKVHARIAGEEADGALRVEAGVVDARERLLASAVGIWVPVRDSRVRAGKGRRQ